MSDYRQQRKEIRRQERKWRRSQKQGEQSMNPLRKALESFLPPYMIPGNVGDVNQVTWPFWEVVSFNFGTNPTWSPTTRQTASFQVTQEAGFLLTSISRKSYGYDTSNDLAPLQFEIRDRQSSRQLNDRAIPLQMIGKRSLPTILPTPMLLMPNAFIDVTMTSWITASMASTGNGRVDLVFHGYRIRVEDQEKVLSTIFG